jgi:hypothetical protein
MNQMNQIDRTGLRVVRGDATPEEIAALVAVVTARARRAAAARDRAAGPAGFRGSAGSGGGGTGHPSAWADRSRAMRTPLPHGPGAWRAAARPR